MYQLLFTSPFGFVLELDGIIPYQQETVYQVLVNHTVIWSGKSNVCSVFGLMPSTQYHIEITGEFPPISFIYTTQTVDYIIDVRNYGITGNQTLDHTAIINAAIYSAPVGAVIRLPKGYYCVSHIFLKSGVDLYLESGAVLQQKTDRTQLAILRGYQKSYDHTTAQVNASWEGNPLDCYASLIYGKQVTDVRIYGDGTLNGNGEQGGWWQDHRTKKNAFRPRNVFLSHCKRITLAGISSKNSAAWNIHPFYSDDLRFYDLKIQSNPTSPNTDGLNPESCEQVKIVGCHFQTGDDCIAIKSGKFYMSRHHYKPSRHIIIRNCLMEKGHGGVVIGSELSCGVQDVRVEQCLFCGTDRGLRIKTRRGRGDTAVVDGVFFHNVTMVDVTDCFVVNMFYFCDPDGHSDYVRSKQKLPVTVETPVVKNIHLSTVQATHIAGCAVFLYGLPESPISQVVIEDCDFNFLPERTVSCPAMMDDPVLIPQLGVYLKHTTNELFSRNRFTGSYVKLVNGVKDQHE